MDGRRRVVILCGAAAAIAPGAVLMARQGAIGDFGAGMILGLALTMAIAGAVVFGRGGKSCPRG
jgi:hypothetical protein